MRDDYTFIEEAKIAEISLWMHRRVDTKACSGCELYRKYEGPSIMKEKCWECFEKHHQQ